MLPAQTFEMRKCLLNLSLAKLRYNAGRNFENL
jgi:hypothetical protein